MAGLYIHIPYCRRKCLYCDFFSGGARIAEWEALTDAILHEAEIRKSELNEPVSTLYLGGGTPSILPAGQLQRLVSGLRTIFGDRWRPAESTIELNPDDVTAEYVTRLTALGFDRLSLGIQVLDDELLKTIGRQHNAATALTAIDMIMERGINLSVDLIFGLPGMTRDTWHDTVATVVARRPQHISAYALMYEPGTALTALRDAGRIVATPDEEYEWQYLHLTSMLKSAGYEHYETSNYSLPGYRSRHNTSYWLGTPYLGLGPGAHSYDGGRTRRANLPDLKNYLRKDFRHTDESLTDEMLADEYLLTRLRLSEGFDIDDYRRRFGTERAQNLHKTALLPPGVAVTGTSIFIRPEAILRSDDIISTLAAGV